MLFNTFGNRENPVIIMLAGSFCPAESLEMVYSVMKEDYYVIAPTYNGHYKDSKDFTTRQGEAKEIADYLQNENITSVRMIYGQSMGSEIGIELMRQLSENNIGIDSAFFDGAPCIKLSRLYKAFMRFKFNTLINMFKGKTLDEAMNIGLVKEFSNGNPEALKPMIEPILEIAPYLSKNSLKNEVECCYTFDFPTFSEEMQKNMYFFYGSEEKAYKTCYHLVRKAYPKANFRVAENYGHVTYLNDNREEYLGWLKEICEDN